MMKLRPLPPMTHNDNWNYVRVPVHHEESDYGTVYSVWYTDTYMHRYTNKDLPYDMAVNIAMIKTFNTVNPYGKDFIDNDRLGSAIYSPHNLGDHDEDKTMLYTGWELPPSYYCVVLRRETLSLYMDNVLLKPTNIYSTGETA
jgi:hypothetical protein